MTSSSSPSFNSLSWLQNGMQLHLQRAMDEVATRKDVQHCLNDMITNIEWADRCNQHVTLHETQQALALTQRQQAQIVQETSLVRTKQQAQQKSLADALVCELYHISKDLGELYQLRQDHEELSQNYDSLVAKLLQAEERIQFMQEGGGSGGGGGGESNDSNEEEKAKEEEEPLTQPAEERQEDTKPSAAGEALPPDADAAAPAAVVSDEAGPPIELPPSAVSKDSEESNSNDKVSPTSDFEATSAAVDVSTLTMPPEGEATPPVGSAAKQPEETSPPSESQQQQQPPTASVVLVEQEDEEPPRLETLDTQVLMHIFAYLDALDILNTAQVNISMYSRVDNLFGLGDVPPGDTSTIATTDSVAAAEQAPAPAPVPAPVEPQPTRVVLPPEPQTTAAAAATTATTEKPPAAQPPAATAATPAATTSQPPSRPPSRPTTPKQGQTSTGSASATTATAPASGASSVSSSTTPAQGAERTLFGFLQPRKGPLSPNAGSTATTPPSSGSGSNTPTRKNPTRPSPPEPAPMNAAMANSMASKLTDAELNAIIHMTDRLRTKESQLEQMRSERERLLAQLDGTDAVKQFLVAKVRSMEESLRSTEEQQAKVAQQIASDQEVIAFLDGRVQELEQSLTNKETETSNLEGQMQAYQLQAEQKSNVLTDMLRFERERVQETQNEFRATKKLLVKEVKSCRAQITAFTAENHALQQENDTLKRALLHGGGGGAGAASLTPSKFPVRTGST